MKRYTIILLVLIGLSAHAEEADSLRPLSYQYMAEIGQMLISDQIVDGTVVSIDPLTYMARGIDLAALLAKVDSMQVVSVHSQVAYLEELNQVDAALKADRTLLRNRYLAERERLSARCEAMLDSIQAGHKPTYTMDAYAADLKAITADYSQQNQLLGMLYTFRLMELAKAYEPDLYFYVYGRMHPLMAYVMDTLAEGYQGTDDTDVCIAAQLKWLVLGASSTLNPHQTLQLRQRLLELANLGTNQQARRQLELALQQINE